MTKFTNQEYRVIRSCFNEVVNGIPEQYTLKLNYNHQAMSSLFDQVIEGKDQFTKEDLILIKKAILIVIDNLDCADISILISVSSEELLQLLNKIMVAIGDQWQPSE